MVASNSGTASPKLGPSQRPSSNVFFGSFSTKVPELEDEGWSDDLLAAACIEYGWITLSQARKSCNGI